MTITVPFLLLFPQKNGSSYLENIPANFWGVAVRELPESVYAAIMHRAALSTILLDLPADQLNLPPIDQVAPESATTTLLIAQRPKEDRAAAESLRTAPRRSKYSTALGKRGEEIALQYLRQTLSFHEAATLRWTASEGDLPGWDIEVHVIGRTERNRGQGVCRSCLSVNRTQLERMGLRQTSGCSVSAHACGTG